MSERTKSHDAVAAILIFEDLLGHDVKLSRVRLAIDEIVRRVREADGCRDRCYNPQGAGFWRYCTLPAQHSGTHTDGAASWRAGHDGPEPVPPKAVVHESGEVTP